LLFTPHRCTHTPQLCSFLVIDLPTPFNYSLSLHDALPILHTLGDYFRQQGAEVTTLRFGFPPELLDAYAPDLVVMSPGPGRPARSEEHTSELQSLTNLVCRLLLEKKTDSPDHHCTSVLATT